MERHFLEGRIRLLYYLFAFALALATVAGSLLRADPVPKWGLIGVSWLTGLLAAVAWAAFATIRNWNIALSRYDRWKRAVLGTRYSELEIRSRMNGGLPARMPIYSEASAITIELPAVLVALASLVASYACASWAVTAGVAPEWFPMIGPAMALVSGVAYGASPDTIAQLPFVQWLWRLLGRPAPLKRAFPFAYALAYLLLIWLVAVVAAMLPPVARSL